MSAHRPRKPQNRGIYTMYHGTSVASARLIIASGFLPSSCGTLGPGVYVSRDQRKAAAYPRRSPDYDRVTLKLRVQVGRVKRIDQYNHPLRLTWHSHGYDTAWVPPNSGMKTVPRGLQENCVFDPRRVQVVGIARAPNTYILRELQQLLSQKSTEYHGGGGGTRNRGVYTMYHGSTVANTRPITGNGFIESSGEILRPRVYVSRDQRKADRYPLNSQPSNFVVPELRVHPGYIRPIDQYNHPVQYTRSSQGYDTAWVPPNYGMRAVPSGLEENCEFYPRRVQAEGIASTNYLGLRGLLPQISTNYNRGVHRTRNRGIFTMYHGTTVASASRIIANGFVQSPKGMLGPGVYVSRDQLKADRYPLNIQPSDRVVLELRVHIGRVKRIDKDNHPVRNMDEKDMPFVVNKISSIKSSRTFHM